MYSPLKMHVKPSNRSLGAHPKRTKSGKLKKSKKSSLSQDDKNMEGFKPAPLDDEYVSELSKITEILKAVNVYDDMSISAAAAGSDPVSTGTSRGKTIPGTEGNSLAGHAVQRPLSGDELKQLLSSITRVISLHNLPGNEQSAQSGSASGLPTILAVESDEEKNQVDVPVDDVNATGSVRKAKKKKRKVKKSSTYSVANSRPALISKSRMISNATSKSKTSKRKSRSKRKSVDRLNSRRPYNEGGSSVTSLDKDPVQNAVFLRKYFEESTRLANKKSSADLVVQTDSLVAEDDVASTTSKKKKGKKKGKKDGGTNAPSKKASKRSIPTTKKTSQQSVVKSSLSSRQSDRVNVSKDVTKKSSIVDSSRILQRQQQLTTTWRRSSSKSRKGSTDKGKHRKMKSNISTTAVASDSPKPFSPVNNKGDGENIIEILNADFSTKPSTQPTNPSIPTSVVAQPEAIKIKGPPTPPVSIAGIGSPRQDVQFKNIEEVINSKFSVNTTKMKSVWEKTPYQPMTHARFRDMVSKYASPEATLALAKAGDIIQPTQASTKVSATIPSTLPIGAAPGTLLTLPKPWEIKEKLAEEANKDKTLKQLQGPPRYWPDSESTSTYNRLNYDYKSSLRKEARHIRKALREDAMRNRQATVNNQDNLLHSTAAAPNEVVDALKFYRDAMKRQNVKKMY